MNDSNRSSTAATQAAPSPARGAIPVGANGVREIDASTTEEWMRRGDATLLDVREPDEHLRERIAGARSVPLSSLDACALADAAAQGGTLVLHCRSGRRSADAARQLLAAGASPDRIFSMSGGIEAWKSSQRPVEVDRRVARLSVMRQVQLTIGTGLLIASALAWLVHPAFIGLAAFFGAGLVFAGATGTCGLALVLERMPWNRAGCAASAPATGAKATSP